ncbi:MAG TPA: ATP-binding cassette domain-containing protein [Verrucomicrobiae bacterium]
MSARLRVLNIRKSFGGTHALKRVSLEVAPGEVHALIGENGAGKSTLMKILSGAYQPDAGQIFLNGAVYQPRDPLHARRKGVEMIYQELNLAPHLSVEENILLGVEPRRFGFVNRRARREAARRVLAELNHADLPTEAPIHTCSIAQQQMVEIARALLGSPQLLIMDEPTSSLTQVDTENLFRAIARLKSRGVSIIYISHFLEECKRIADRYTVLRDGETIASGEMPGADLNQIIHHMVGRELEEIYPEIPHPIGEPILRIKNLAGKRRPQDATLTLHRGEILGLAGLIGAGRTETLRTLFGLDRLHSGEITLVGDDRRSPSASFVGDDVRSPSASFVGDDVRSPSLRLPQSPQPIDKTSAPLPPSSDGSSPGGAPPSREAATSPGGARLRPSVGGPCGEPFHPTPPRSLARGLGLLSENRKEEGLMLNLSLAENLTLPRLKPFTRAAILDRADQRRTTATWIDRLRVRARDPLQPISELSGGNQQKIAIGRLLHCDSQILLLDEPTRGIDVASKAQIYELIGELAAAGKSIIFVSSYLPELLGVCDTIAVMCRGRIVASRPARDWTEHSIITAAIGHSC